MAELSIERLLGERVRKLRILKGFTQREFTRRVESGLDLSYLGRIERGEQLPSLKVLRRLADALGVSVAELFATDTAAAPGGLDRVHLTLWRTIQQVPRPDLPLLLQVARLLARRRPRAGRYPVGRAAEREPRRRSRR